MKKQLSVRANLMTPILPMLVSASMLRCWYFCKYQAKGISIASFLAFVKERAEPSSSIVETANPHFSCALFFWTSAAWRSGSLFQAEACKSVDQALKKCPNGMYAEIKYDGERVQVHKQGDSFSYFSRSLKPVLAHKVSDTTPLSTQIFSLVGLWHGEDTKAPLPRSSRTRLPHSRKKGIPIARGHAGPPPPSGPDVPPPHLTWSRDGYSLDGITWSLGGARPLRRASESFSLTDRTMFRSFLWLTFVLFSCVIKCHLLHRMCLRNKRWKS